MSDSVERSSREVQSSFCVLPWTQLEVRTDGRMAPCCHSQKTIARDDGRGDFYLHTDTVEEAFQSDFMRKLRANLASGVRDENCAVCWLQESTGQKSQRHAENRRSGSHVAPALGGKVPAQPISLDLKFGNFCNLKCRICTPYNSSKWVDEHVAVYGHDSLTRATPELAAMRKEDSRELMMTWHDSNPRFWATLEKWLPNIEHFQVFGGEPFLIKRHFDVLRRSIEIGASGRQTLHYNTNCTIYPQEAVEEIFPRFRHVNIMLSLDGIGEQFEYQRHPAKWEQVLKNAEKFAASSAQVQICLTVSAINIFYVPDYLEYWLGKGIPVYLNMVYSPDHFDSRVLPPHVKKRITDKFARIPAGKFDSLLLNELMPVVHHMNSGDHSLLWPRFLKTVAFHDAYRKESFVRVFPELSALFTPEARDARV